jgi:hypothetical protein
MPFIGTLGQLPSQVPDGRFAIEQVTTRIDYRYSLPSPFLNHSYVEVGTNLNTQDFQNGVHRFGDQPILDVYNVDQIAGFVDGTRRWLADLHALLDLRTSRRFGGGPWVDGYFDVAHGFSFDDSSDYSLIGSAGYAFNLRDRVLFFRVMAGFQNQFTDVPIPFTYLLSPAGSNGIRGLPDGIVRASRVLVGSIEYHWLLNSWLDGMLMGDVGGGWPMGTHPFAGQAAGSIGLGIRAYGATGPYRARTPAGEAYLAWAVGQGVVFSLKLYSF